MVLQTFSDFQRDLADALTVALGVAQTLKRADGRMSDEKRVELLDTLLRRVEELRYGLIPILNKI